MHNNVSYDFKFSFPLEYHCFINRSLTEKVCTDSIAYKIKQYRLQNNIMLKDLANRLDIHRTTVTDYEQGKTIPNNDVLKQIESILNLEQYSLFDEYHLFIENLNEEIERIKRDFYLSDASFARKCGITKATVHGWKTKKIKPSYKTWLKIKTLFF